MIFIPSNGGCLLMNYVTFKQFTIRKVVEMKEVGNKKK